MKEEMENMKKRLKKQAEDMFEIDENSDIPIHERYVKEEDIKRIKRKKT